VRKDQLQPLPEDFVFCSSLLSSVPPAPEVLPLQALWELPAPDLSPLQALFPAHPLMLSAEPDIRLATQRPAKIFFRSLASIVASCLVKGLNQVFPWGGKYASLVDCMFYNLTKSKPIVKE
jgi:hypothetical protein